jgi:hypothetical protein
MVLLSILTFMLTGLVAIVFSGQISEALTDKQDHLTIASRSKLADSDLIGSCS